MPWLALLMYGNTPKLRSLRDDFRQSGHCEIGSRYEKQGYKNRLVNNTNSEFDRSRSEGGNLSTRGRFIYKAHIGKPSI